MSEARYGGYPTHVYPKELTPQASRVERALVDYKKEVNPPFFVTGEVENCPSLKIFAGEPGLEDVLKPPYEETVEELYSVGEQSQVGTAEKTSLRLDARKSKEFSKLVVLNESWNDTLSEVCTRVQQKLAPGAKKVNTDLYKLLIYSKGDFFDCHQDAQRSDRMFATLLFFLPVKYDGGEFRVYQRCDWHNSGIIKNGIVPNTCSWVAFYTDVCHEVRKVKEGFRVSLNYSLSFEGAMSPSSFLPPMTQMCKSAITSYFSAYKKKVLVIALTYEYTLATLSPEFLKGVDAYIFNAIEMFASPELRFVLRFDKTKVIECYFGNGEYDHDREDVFQNVFLMTHKIAQRYFDIFEESQQKNKQEEVQEQLDEKQLTSRRKKEQALREERNEKYLALMREVKASQNDLDLEWIIEKAPSPYVTRHAENFYFTWGMTDWLGNQTPAKEYYYLQAAIVVREKK